MPSENYAGKRCDPNKESGIAPQLGFENVWNFHRQDFHGLTECITLRVLSSEIYGEP